MITVATRILVRCAVGPTGNLLIMLVPKELLDRPDYVPVTRTRLAGALIQLGVRRGGVLMVHVRMSALGWMVGGMDAIIWALLDAVGPDGTLLAFTGWEDSPYHVSAWPTDWQAAYQDQPGFDPAVSAARREFGRFPERLRTWPNAQRSSHPEVSFAALGPYAPQLLAEPADGNPWGPEGPLGRLVAADGQVLMLGAPLNRLTLCHHAEAIAQVGGKRYHEYTMPIRTGDHTEWRHYRTLDTFFGTLPYWEREDLKITSWVGTMANQAAVAGATSYGSVDSCPLILVNATEAVAAVKEWIEANFSAGPAPSDHDQRLRGSAEIDD
jgi:aminoglycoside 3-N-acetyltransferase